MPSFVIARTDMTMRSVKLRIASLLMFFVMMILRLSHAPIRLFSAVSRTPHSVMPRTLHSVITRFMRVIQSAANTKWMIRTGRAMVVSALMLTVFFVPQARAQDYTSGLVGHWTLDETTGSTIADSSSNGNNGTWTDGADNNVTGETSSGQVGTSIAFSSGTYVTVPYAASMSFPDDKMTISTWIKLNGDTGSANRIMGKDWLFEMHPNQSVCLSASGYFCTDSRLVVGEWAHVAVVWDNVNGEADLYFNGALEATRTGIPIANINQATPIYLGNGHPSFYLEGQLDDIRIYNRALTDADITALYNHERCTNPREPEGTVVFDEDSRRMMFCNGTNWVAIGAANSIPTSGLIGHWKLDETSGAIVEDSSGNDYDGSYISGLDPATNAEPGIIGNGINIQDGTNQRIEVPTNAALEGLTAFTMALWMKPADFAGINGMFEVRGLGVIHSGFNSNDIRFYAGGWDVKVGGWNIGPNNSYVIADEWVHYAVTYDYGDPRGTRPIVYINGRAVSTGVPSAPDGTFTPPATAKVYIGAGHYVHSSTLRDYSGVIDDVRLYNRELDASEIAQLHSLGFSAHKYLTLVDNNTVPNDSSYSVSDGTYLYNSSTYNLYAYRREGAEISVVGNPFDNAGLLNDLVYDGTYIHGRTRFPHRLYALTFDGTDFTQVGNYFSFANDTSGLAGDGTYLYLVDGVNGLQAYDFDGTDYNLRDTWGDVTSLGNVETHNGYIFTSAGNEIYVLTYDGDDFTLLANDTCEDTQCGGTAQFAFKDDYVFVAHQSSGRRVHAFEFDGSTLTEIDSTTDMGSSFTGGKPAFFDDYLFVPGSGGRTYVFRFDGSSLKVVEFLDDGAESYAHLYTDGMALYRGDASGGLKVYAGYGLNLGLGEKYCTSPYQPQAAIVFNDSYDVMQYCNGAEWIAMGPQGDGGGGCSSPTGLQAELIYNNDFHMLQYCEGDEWIAVAGIDDITSIGLIGHWKLDDTSGSTVVDSSGNGYDGTWIDNVNADVAEESVVAIDSTGLELDGTDDEINLDAIPGLDMDTTNAFTIAAWVYPDSTTGKASIFSRGAVFSGADNTVYNLSRSEDSWHAAVSDGTTLQQYYSPSSVVAGTWQHVVLTWDGTILEVYKDATSVGSLDTGGLALQSGVGANSRTSIGADGRSSNDFWDGELDDVRLYDRALNATEVATLYNSYSPSVTLSTGLLAHYKLDETSGTTAADSSGNGNDGTMLGGLDAGNDTAAGVDGTAIDFGGIGGDDIIAIPDFLGNETALTVSAWVNADSWPGSGYVDVITLPQDSGTSNMMSITYNASTDNISFALRNSSDVSVGAGSGYNSPASNEWMLITGVYDGAEVKFYVNGTFVDSAAQTGTLMDSNNILAIGGKWQSGLYPAGSANWEFDGAIDDVRIYNRALSDSEVADLYNTYTPPLEIGLVAHWKLDETSGTTLADNTGNGYDGAWTGGTDVVSTTGVDGTAVTFDDTDDYFDASIPAGLTDYTYTAWVYPHNTSNQYVVDRQSSTNNIASLMINGGNYVHQHRDDDGSNLASLSGASVVPGQWQHVAWGREKGTNFFIAVDGVKVTSADAAGDLEPPLPRFGKHATSANYFDGTMDDIRLYDRALSESELSALYAADAPAALAPQLLAHWKLDETTGTTITDDTGNGYDGTFSGAANVTSTTGIDATALSFDGTDDHIDITNIPQLSNYTYSAWIYVDSFTSGTESNGTFFVDRSSDTSSLASLKAENGKFTHQFRQNDSDGYGTLEGADIQTGQWHHVTWGREVGTNLFITVDGVKYTTADVSGIIHPPAPRIGGHDTEDHFDGIIDDVRLYNYALSDAETTALYAMGAPTSAGLIAHYTLDETSGTTATDSSPIGNDGTYTNGVLPASHSTGGVESTAIDFGNGANHYVQASSTANYTGMTTLTYAAWINTSAFNNFMGIVDIGDIGAMFLNFNENDLRFTADGWDTTAGSWSAPDVINQDEWMHVAVTYDYGDISNAPILYVNGSVVVSGVATPPAGSFAAPGSADLTIGNTDISGFGRNFNGSIDDVRVYDRILSASEISELYNTYTPPLDPAAGLIAHWKLDETGGGTTEAVDSSGSGYEGTMSGGLTGADTIVGVDGSALDFDGTEIIYATKDGTDEISPLTGTVSVWINPALASSGSSREQIVQLSRYDAGNTNKIHIARASNGNLASSLGTKPDVVDSGTYVAPNKWSHATLTWDNGNYELYLDGVSVDSGTYSGLNNITYCPIIGGYSNNCTNSSNSRFTGGIDDVRVYNYALSDSEVSDLYDTYTPPLDPAAGLLAHYKLDETTGSAIADSSGNGNDATFSDNDANDVADGKIPGVDGTGLDFSGSWHKQIRDDDFAFPDEGTFAAWVTTNFEESNNPNGSYPILLGAGADADTFLFYHAGAEQYRMRIDGADVASYTPPTDIVGWFHIAVNWSASGSQIYINGAPVGTASTDDESLSSLVGLSIADRTSFNRYWDGNIDDVRIYNRALSDGEVSDLYDTYTPPEPLEFGLVGHWTLDETSGDAITDSSGSGIDGTWDDNVNDDVTEETISAVESTGLSFDGTDDIISLGDTLDLTDEITICAWAKPTNTTTGYIVGKFSSTGYFLRADINDGWTMGTDATNFVHQPSSMGFDTWQHVCAVIDPGATSTLYKDAVAINSSTGVLAHTNNAVALTIGNRHDNNRDFEGELDDVRIYNRALSATEITDLYDTYTPPEDIATGLVGHWELDETTGTAVSDSSDSGYDGTMTGGVTGDANAVVAPQSTGIQFDGVDDYVNIDGAQADLQITGSMTIATWVKGDQMNELEHLVSKQGNTPDYGWRLASGGSYFRMGITADGVNMVERHSTTDPADDTWYHVATVYDADAQTLDMYVNGALDNGTLSGTVPAAQNNSSRPVRLGTRPGGGRQFDGTLDDVRIYNRALDASEIEAIYDLYTPPPTIPTAGLSVWLAGDDVDGDGATGNNPASGALTQWNDKSGNANHASQGTGSRQPTTGTRSINGVNAIDFDGNDDLNGTSLGLSAYTKFIIVERDSNAAQNNLIAKVTGNNDAIYGDGTSNNYLFHNGSRFITQSSINENQAYIVTATSDSSGNAEFFHDGVSSGTGTASYGSGGSASYAIGSFDGGYFLDGLIAEVIVYDRVLTAPELLQVHNYLSSKYGI